MQADLRQRLIDLIDYFTPLLVRMCAQAGVFASFAEGERRLQDVAAETGLDAVVLQRVVRALSSRGVFEPGGEGRFRLSTLGRLLVPGAPGSLAGMAVFRAMDLHAWAEGMHSLRTGQASFPVHYGHGHWTHLAANPDLSALFNRQMAARTTTLLDLGMDRYRWPQRGTVVDLGGGSGLLLSRVLRGRLGVRGILFDLPHVVDEATTAVQGLAERLEVRSGDLFVDPLPTEGDLYILASVLHDWNDAEAEALLARVRGVMRPEARLLLFESVLSDGPEPDFGKLLDLHMLMLFGARERTEEDWRGLLQRCKFEVTALIRTPGLAWIEAAPA